MTRVPFIFSFIFLILVLLGAFVVWPELDLAVSGFFAQGVDGFYLRDNVVLNALSKGAFYGARLMAGFFFCAVLLAYWRKRKPLGLSGKAWLFLFLSLLIGPGLVSNVLFKDHWGRARPKQIVEFGGTKTFSRAFEISTACDRNCSFVSGDASFGFFLPCFAYVVPRRMSRRVFWSGVGAGSVFALARILLGAHFASDVLCAALVTLLVSFGLHALMFRARETANHWRGWLGLSPVVSAA